MATRLDVAFMPLCSAAIQKHQVRFKKPDIRKHRHAHWDRMKLLEFTKPTYEIENSTTQHLWKDCPREKELKAKYEENRKANELEILYARQMKDLFERASMIGVFHANSIRGRAERAAWQNARRHGMELKIYNRRICREALQGTKWEESVMLLAEASPSQTRFTFYLGPPEQVDPSQLLAYDKKVPEYILLATIIGNRMLDRAGVTYAATSLYPRGIESLHGELSAVLQSPSQKICSLLGRIQQTLSQSLEQYIKDQQNGTSDSKLDPK